MPNLSHEQLELIADACDFYFSHLARLAAAASADEFVYLSDAADACADIAEEARNAVEVQ